MPDNRVFEYTKPFSTPLLGDPTCSHVVIRDDSRVVVVTLLEGISPEAVYAWLRAGLLRAVDDSPSPEAQSETAASSAA